MVGGWGISHGRNAEKNGRKARKRGRGLTVAGRGCKHLSRLSVGVR